MMTLSNFRSICGFRQSIESGCLKCIPSCLLRHHQVHPVLLQDDNCEFLQLHPQRRIRVIHYNPENDVDVVDSTRRELEEDFTNPHEDAPTDEYWFIRCSHSSYRLLRKKDKKCESSNPPLRQTGLNNSTFDKVRYSFHKKERLKPCIEEQENQNKSLDLIISSLVNNLMNEALIDAVQLLHKHQRRTMTNECLPQANNIENGNVINTSSGCRNEGFITNDEESHQESDNLKNPQTLSGNVTRQNMTTDEPTRTSSHTKCKRSKKSNKPLLLFLHGAGSSAEIWSSLITYFAAAGYEIAAPDLLGHGYSSAPSQRSAYTFACLLQDALQIFDTFVTEHKKCVVIGHAYGCSFAAAVARYRPQSVAQLVLISGGGPTPLAPHQGTYALPRCLLACAKPLLLCGFRRELFYAARGKQLVFNEDLVSEVPRNVLHHLQSGQAWPQGDAAFHRRIQVPTLLVHGITDPHITLVEECEMERAIPRSFLEVISDAGHWSMLEAPQQLCHMLHCFITLWDRAGALSK